jgi:hypothetical protein
MFKSNKTYTNRYRDEYKWVAENETTYRFEMTGNSLEYCRYGGKEGVEGIDANDLGMFDPSGGPYVSLGMEIDGRPITRLYNSESGFCAEVK